MLPGGQVFPSSCYIETLPLCGSWRQRSLVLVVTGVCAHTREGTRPAGLYPHTPLAVGDHGPGDRQRTSLAKLLEL